MDDAERPAGAPPTRAPMRLRGARCGGVWRRSVEYAGVLVVALGGTAVLYGAAVGDRDILEVLAFLVLAAVLFQFLVAWVAGPVRDTRAAVVVGRGAAGVFALAIAVLLAWPSGDWIPDNDPAATDAFVSPSVNLAQVWIYFMPGYALAVLVLLIALRVRHRRKASSPPPSPSEATAPGTASAPPTRSEPPTPSASTPLGAPAALAAAGRRRRVPVAEAADLLVIGLPMAAILLLEGLLPLPSDGVGYTLVVVLTGAWCAVSSVAGALWLSRRTR